MESKARSTLPLTALLCVLNVIPTVLAASYELCPNEVCGVGYEPPSDPADCSSVIQLEIGNNGWEPCLCMRGQKAQEPCEKNGDCIRGFHCEKNKCVCPCDNPTRPFCSYPYSKCEMSGGNATCRCQAKYDCSETLSVPVCVFWGDTDDDGFGRATEYQNPCLFIADSCNMPSSIPRWMEPGSCLGIKGFEIGILGGHGGPLHWEYKLPSPGFGLGLINVNPASPYPEPFPFGHGVFAMPEPEPEAEPSK